MSGKAPYVLKLRLRGRGVRSGAIAVPDLVKICQATQEAVNRQAEALRGGGSRRPGPHARAILDECTLELTGVGKGSTVLPFRLAQAQQRLEEPLCLGAAAVRALGEALKQVSRRRPGFQCDPGVLASLGELSQALDGVEAIDWIVPASGGQPRVEAVLTPEIRARMRSEQREPAVSPLVVEGVLEMADFKASDQRCRIRPPFGPPVPCTFPPERAEAIYAALRQAVRVSGQAKVAQDTGRTLELALESLEFIAEPQTGETTFFEATDLNALAAQQDVKPLKNPEALEGGWPGDEDLDSFLESIYTERRA